MVERALHHLVALMLHIVAKIIEAQLVIGRIGDVAIISVAPLILGQIGHDHAGGKAKIAVDLPHPFRVTLCEIVVHGYDMHALAFDGVEIGGERCHQSLAFTGAHFGDFAAVEHDAAHHLHVEVAHT